MPEALSSRRHPVTDTTRAAFGFALGLAVMLVATRVFQVNTYDFANLQRGVQTLLTGVSPWAAETRIPDYYNPPFAVLFLWPTLLTTPQVFLSLGAGCLFA